MALFRTRSLAAILAIPVLSLLASSTAAVEPPSWAKKVYPDIQVVDDSKATMKETVDWLKKTLASDAFMSSGSKAPTELEHRTKEPEAILIWTNLGQTPGDVTTDMSASEMPLDNIDTEKFGLLENSYGTLYLRIYPKKGVFHSYFGPFYGKIGARDMYGSRVTVIKDTECDIVVPSKEMAVRVGRAIVHAAVLSQSKPEPF